MILLGHPLPGLLLPGLSTFHRQGSGAVPRRPVAMPLWYLRTYEDEDTHWGLFDGTTVTSVCHEKFEPMVTALPGIEPVMALHGDPADPAQVCPQCQRAIAHGNSAPAGGE